MPHHHHCEQRPDLLLQQVASALRRVYPNRPQSELDEARAEAICRLYEKIHHSGRPPFSPAAWAFTVAVNVIRHEHRRAGRHVRSAQGADDGFPIAEFLPGDARSDETASTGLIRALLDALPASVAEAVWLHDVEEWKPSEIADMLGCTTNAINLRIKRGRRHLQRILRSEIVSAENPAFADDTARGRDAQ